MANIAIMDTLDQIETLVSTGSHVPLTQMTMINEDDLVHLVEVLRQDLPQELSRAESIMREEENIIREAQRKAEEIIREAEDKAEQILNEEAIMVQAREKAMNMIEQAEMQAKEVTTRASESAWTLQNNANQYANQVFDQLINHVSNTFQGVRQAQQGLDQARNVLLSAKDQMNRQAAEHEQEAAERQAKME